MENESNFALYRQQIKNISPNMDEVKIYEGWHKVTYGDWKIQQSPIKGYDGRYHYIYAEVRDDGRIYIGKHSTTNLNDSYIGSGVEILPSLKDGHTFKKSVLEYFRSEKAAEEAEHKIVNARYLIESKDIVLNHTEGGKDYQPPTLMPKTSEPRKPTDFKPTTEKRRKGFSFGELNVLNKDLTFFNNDCITCKVISDWKVSWNGSDYGLSELTKKVSDIKFSNPLELWKCDGKLLTEYRDSCTTRKATKKYDINKRVDEIFA